MTKKEVVHICFHPGSSWRERERDRPAQSRRKREQSVRAQTRFHGWRLARELSCLELK